VQALLGLSGGNLLTSPAGYLDSQFFANILPVMLLVFAIGLAAWTVAGDEAAGSLELLLANPVSRLRVALARFTALVCLIAALAAVCVLALATLAPSTGLDHGLSVARIAAAATAAALLALTFAAVAFAVGAATGNRPAAAGAAAASAVGAYGSSRPGQTCVSVPLGHLTSGVIPERSGAGQPPSVGSLWLVCAGFPAWCRRTPARGRGHRLDRRSTRVAGVALTPAPSGA
jgi:hypothetical protein